MKGAELVSLLGLEEHKEGGYFKRIFQADHLSSIDLGYGKRFTLTSIQYLLTRERPTGHWHMNRSDIVHYYQLGSPIMYRILDPNDASMRSIILGPDVANGHQLFLVVKGGMWKASHLADGEFGLVSEAVSPGFEYEDMQFGVRQKLLDEFPQHAEIVNAYCLDVESREGGIVAESTSD